MRSACGGAHAFGRPEFRQFRPDPGTTPGAADLPTSCGVNELDPGNVEKTDAIPRTSSGEYSAAKASAFACDGARPTGRTVSGPAENPTKRPRPFRGARGAAASRAARSAESANARPVSRLRKIAPGCFRRENSIKPPAVNPFTPRLHIPRTEQFQPRLLARIHARNRHPGQNS